MRKHLWIRIGAAAVALVVAAAVLIGRFLDPEPAVYQAVLGESASDRIALVSVPGTCGLWQGTPGAKPFPGSMDRFPSALIESWRKANSVATDWADLAPFRGQFAIANPRQFRARSMQSPRLVETAGPKRLAVVQLTRVGFSADGAMAMLCLKSRNGTYVLRLSRFEDRWQVVEQAEPYFHHW